MYKDRRGTEMTRKCCRGFYAGKHLKCNLDWEIGLCVIALH